jgi:hypothetical protein
MRVKSLLPFSQIWLCELSSVVTLEWMVCGGGGDMAQEAQSVCTPVDDLAEYLGVT